MKNSILLFIALLIFSTGFSQSSKRGIAYGRHSPQDLAALSPEVTWWYNWGIKPENEVAGVFDEYGFDFVPMTWNGSYNEAELRAYLQSHPETKYILAFNEPNFKEQANMTPSQVAAQWPRLEAIADDFDLEIVGPAVNYCGNCVSENGTTYTDPFEYLDDFFAACPDCRVDHIAVHCYMNSASALEWYIGQFKRYGKPIWLTEFNAWDDAADFGIEEQRDYMIQAVNYLESEPSVFRYAWFIGRWNGINNYPHIELLGSNGHLTTLGDVYTKMPVHDENRVIPVPARIQAEEYNRMSGIQVELTSDTSGFLNIGYIDKDDWLEYKLEVPETGSYVVKFRVASTQRARLFVDLNGETIVNQAFDFTGGWQSWETYSSQVDLPAGTHTIRLKAATAGFNVNWFEISDLATGVAAIDNSERITVYPNPGSGKLNIRTTTEINEIQVMNLTGSMVHVQPFASKIDLTFLQPGIYFLKAVGKNGKIRSTQKIIIR